MDKAPYRKELEFTHFKNKNMMGNKFERLHFSQFHRINKLNEQMTLKQESEMKIKREIERYLGTLKLSMKLKPYIYYNYVKYHAYFPKCSKQRGFRLIPVMIYITCLKMNIFITKTRIIAISDRFRKQFHETLKKVLFYDRNLQKLIVSREFRKKYILNVFIGISNQFNFPRGVIIRVNEIFPLFFEKYESLSNTNIIVGLYLIVSHTFSGLRHIADRYIAKFLGVHQSMFSKMKARVL